jgi:hypothetical protein
MLEDRPIIRFVAKVATQSAGAVLATLIGGYVITALNLRNTEPAREASRPAAIDERALTREYVKSLREGRDGRDDIAEVIRAVPSAPEQQGVHETVVAKGVAGQPAVVGAPSIRKENRIRTDVAAAPSAPPPMAAPLGEPIVLAPASVAAVEAEDSRVTRPPAAESTPVGTVFSTLSNALGNAANATGDTINFMIDLPAKALGTRQTERAASPSTPAVPARGSADTSMPPPMRYTGS